MSRTAHICLMADYNAWMNTKLYEAAALLPAEALTEDRKAFFGSILGTLNHLVVADTIWLKRFAAEPGRFAALDPIRDTTLPERLDLPMFDNLPELIVYREWLDVVITNWTSLLTEAELDIVIHYANMRGAEFDKPLFGLLVHFFNHQTHHRGQASTLLTQAGVDIGVTDLLALIPNVSI